MDVQVDRQVEVYEHLADYLSDELDRLDTAIELEIQRLSQAGLLMAEDDDSTASFHDMVMTPEEASLLLSTDTYDDEISAGRRERLEQLDAFIAMRLTATLEGGIELPVHHLRGRFRLDDLDLRLLITGLAPHLDRKYLRLFGYLHDDLTRQYLTPDLLIRLCCRNEAERQAAFARLIRAEGEWRYFVVRPPASEALQYTSVLMQPVRLADRIIHFLLGLDWRHSGPLTAMRLYPLEEKPPPILVNREVHERLERRAFMAVPAGRTVIWHLHGPAGAGKTLHARHISRSLGRSLLEWDVAGAPSDEAAFKESVKLMLFEARLLDAIPAFDGVHRLFDPQEARDRRWNWLTTQLAAWEDIAFCFAETEIRPSGLPAHAGWVADAIPLPDLEQSRQLWRHLAGGRLSIGDDTAAELAAKFRFPPGLIAGSVETAEQMIAVEGEPSAGLESVVPVPAVKWLESAARSNLNRRISDKAVKLESRFRWKDLILPEETLSLLKQAAMRLKHRHTVMHSWGFEARLPYGRGISMLFTGPPGTGKTMSAMVMGNEMGVDVYRIDLSRVVSKYIGETEKNLAEIFDLARLGGAILFFDEADALFGKRSEVKDAHDKYANMETSYLLQKMEEYDGLTILATNYKQNLDEAFMRRIHYIVRFPFPDAEQRERLWRTCMPADMPAEDLDIPLLARSFELAGGPIKNIVLTAAYLAAADGSPVTMRHILLGVVQEYKKTGKVLLKEHLNWLEEVSRSG